MGFLNSCKVCKIAARMWSFLVDAYTCSRHPLHYTTPQVNDSFPDLSGWVLRAVPVQLHPYPNPETYSPEKTKLCHFASALTTPAFKTPGTAVHQHHQNKISQVWPQLLVRSLDYSSYTVSPLSSTGERNAVDGRGLEPT